MPLAQRKSTPTEVEDQARCLPNEPAGVVVEAVDVDSVDVTSDLHNGNLVSATRPGCTPDPGSQPGLGDPSVSADVLLNESGEPVFDGVDRSRAVLVVLFVAQQGGQCGGVGELLHRGCDFADGEVVVVVDG
jgi:hypothetical protein